MKLRNISENEGKSNKVSTRIHDREDLKSSYMEPEDEAVDVPGWHKDLVRKRLAEYHDNPDIALDFDFTLDDIEEDLY